MNATSEQYANALKQVFSLLESAQAATSALSCEECVTLLTYGHDITECIRLNRSSDTLQSAFDALNRFAARLKTGSKWNVSDCATLYTSLTALGKFIAGVPKPAAQTQSTVPADVKANSA